MYAIDDFKTDIEVNHAEVTFAYGDGLYIISENMGEGPNGEPLRYFGPENDGFAYNAEDVLDKLMVDGKPMRDRMDEIEPD